MFFYNNRCSLLENETGANRPSVFASVLEELDRQIKHLEAEIKRKEKWVEVSTIMTKTCFFIKRNIYA